MKKQAKQFEKGWIDLCLKYRQWEDLKVKGKMKMKKKTNKDGKYYYDFDFTRYQYYYSYPQDHIGLAPPQIQKQFINHIMENSYENFSEMYLDNEKSNWKQIENMLKPLELHQFLRDISRQLTEKITSLRLEKALRIKKLKGIFGPQNEYQKSMIELIEAQIRSLMYKQIRLQNKYCLLGDGLQQRIKNHKSYLKTRTIDQFQFTDLSKADMNVFMRIRQTKQALMGSCQTLKSVVRNYFDHNLSEIKRKVLEARASKIQKQKQLSQAQRIILEQRLIKKINQLEPTHFDNPDNKQKLESLISKLDYIQNFQNNIQKTMTQKIYSKNFTSLQLNYEELSYIPKSNTQIKDRLINMVQYYFNKNLINEQIMKSSDEHICYKINNLCSLQLKVLWESYNFSQQKQESSLIKIRSMMRKQLELVFSRNVNNLLNIRNHSIKVSVGEKWIPKLLYQYRPQSQKESIFNSEMNNPTRFKDSLICSFLELLGANKDKVVREQIDKYAKKVKQNSVNLLKYRCLYYENCCSDQKIHFINILNHNISLGKKKQDQVITYYYQLLQQLDSESGTDENILYSYYLLVFLRCSEARYQLMQVLNAQIMCMIKIQSRIKLLWKKSKMPFQMSKQFVERFIDPTDFNEHGFKFLSPEACQSHIEQLFKQMYNQDAERDYIQWNADIGIETRRNKSQNTLLQGKSVLYTQTAQLLQQSLTRLQFLCSTCIQYRESYLPEAKLTQIVDRLELIFEFLTLQSRYQTAKLKLLDQYCQQMRLLISADGIISLYNEMNRTMSSNCFVDLTQPHFRQSYEAQIRQYQAKAKVFKMLIKKQKKQETEYIKSQINSYKRANFLNTIPELSSMYYTQQITVQQHSVIQQAAQDQSESISQTQSQIMNTNIVKNTISQVSSMMQSGSNYHLKISFQEVLSKNTLQAIKEQNNKKEEIMNRKKQKIINDSILGGLIPRYRETLIDENQGSGEYFAYLHFVVEAMKYIDTIVPNSELYPQSEVKAVFFQQIITLLQNFLFEDFKPLIKPQELTVCLNNAHKTLNKFIQKFKLQGGISSRSSNEHWLCLNSKIMENIVSNDTGEQIDEMRGLYICLNAFHLNELYYMLKQKQKIQQSSQSQTKIFKKICSLYSNYQIDPKDLDVDHCANFQKRELTLMKLYSQLKQSSQTTYLCIGNYMQYFKGLSIYRIAVDNLLSSFNSFMMLQLQNLKDLQTQIILMQKYQCCTKLFETLHLIPGLQNKVTLRKKLDYIQAYKKSIIQKQSINEFISAIQICTKQIPKFRKIQSKMSLNSMASFAVQFEKYINQIIKSSILLNAVGEQVKSQIYECRQILKVQQICSFLPFIFKHVKINRLSNTAAIQIFKQHRELIENKRKLNDKGIKLNIVEEKVSISGIVDYILSAGDRIKTWVRDECSRRKKQQIVGDNKKLQFLKYLSRHFTNSFNSMQSQLEKKILSPFLSNHKKYKNLVLFRQWLQVQLIIFGCSLTKNQLIKFRKIFCNPILTFPIFWEDNTKHIISNRELAKLKSTNAQSQDILNSYKNQYLTYVYLKKAYKTFVQDLSEHDFQQQLSDSFLTCYIGAPEFFKPQFQDWSFLTRFCDSFVNEPVSEVDQLCRFLKRSTKFLGFTQNRLSNISQIKEYYNLTQLKYCLWSSEKMQKIKNFDSSRRFIKQRLSQSKSLAIRPITDEVSLPFYRNQKLTEILNYLNIDISEYRQKLQDFRVNFEKYVHEGLIQINSKESFISNMTQKDIQSKGELLKSKQQVMKVISTNQFYMKLIRQKFYEFCSNILQSELKLRQILQEDLHNEEKSRDQRILKQTINKILVPKVKLNPFLASPLRIQNYFFAGTIKLSYIDQFLNKLRNRAVMIELAQGGTGYLLKVNQLDQSVEALCKAIVGFSEKQFADRFRTVFESIQQIKERNYKLSQQNSNLKQIISVVKSYEGKQIKALLYEKLNDYLVSFYQHNKSYDIVVNLLKSIQNKIQSELNMKYSDKIKQLELENKQLRKKLNAKSQSSHQLIKQISSEARDSLYSSFKQKAESILNKEIIPEIDQDIKFQAIQKLDTQALLKKLKMQKAFYEMKLAKMESNFTQKIRNLQKKLLEQSKLQNLLLMQQQKNKSLSNQVKQLHKCSIQNQLLKKEMDKKQQEETMQKFRLVKVNQSLKGKVKRIEDELQKEKSTFSHKLQQLTKVQEKSKTSFSVQVSVDSHKSKRKTFYLKTQSNANPKTNSFDIGIWRQKWFKTEKKYQQLMVNLRKCYEHFLFTKSAANLLENLKFLLGNQQVLRSQSSFDQKSVLK